MEDLTLEELVVEAKKRKIHLGEEPEKTIKTCTKLGLIPKPKGVRQNQGRRQRHSTIPRTRSTNLHT